MGFLFDRYSKVKEKTKGIREAVGGTIGDLGKITYDVSKDNPYAKKMRKDIRKG